MTEEQIIIVIDDSQLQSIRMELDLIEEKAVKTIGGRKPLTSSLPIINREMRIIFGKLPGLRQVMQQMFLLKRVERGIAKGGEQYYLSLIATAIILANTIITYSMRMERERKRYEMLVRRARGWTHEEFVRGTKEWENYLKGMPP